MTNPVLIGLCGKAGAGKDALAAALGPHGYKRVAFADALKQAAYASDPIVAPGTPRRERLSDVVDAVGWDEAKIEYPEVRRYLQAYGVAMRILSPGVWVRIAERRIVDALADGQNVVVTDVRFPDEVDAIREWSGYLVRVERPTLLDLGANAGHVSETALDDIEPDYVVRNEGYLDDLARAATALHNHLAERQAA